MSRVSAGAGEELRLELVRRFGKRCLTEGAKVRLYGYDAMGTAFGVPLAVVQVESPLEIPELVGLVQRHGGRLVARGAGTGLSGGSVPPDGAVVVSLERMQEIAGPDVLHRRIHAGAGVVNGSLDALLEPFGLFYPPDPASYRVSTIGGNVAENAGGPHAVKYGVTGQRVASIELADAQGRQGRLAAGPWQAGPDLVALVTGAEGTLGVVSSVELALEERPEAVVTMLLSFVEIAQASACVSAIIASGLVPATLEFIDRATIAAVEAWGVARYPAGSGAVLLLEFDGREADVEAEVVRAQAMAAEHQALSCETARRQEERDALWLGRRGAYAAVARYGRRVLTQDVTVPRDRLTEMLAAVDEISARYGLRAVTVGHAGDGNLHPDFAYDPDDAEESRRVHQANREVLEACVRLGGSITGEHGIGTEKLDQLEIMFGPAELGLTWAVRRALDPDGLLNPGKAVPEALRVPPPEPEEGTGEGPVRGADDLLRAVAVARRDRTRLSPDLSGLRTIAVSLPNMTARVGAGATVEALAEALAGTSFSFAVQPLCAQTFAELLATNDYGPEEISQGTLRRHLLAVSYVTGYGEHVRFGRDVVKNVAGYDLFRLLIGGDGRLGVPLELTVRLALRRETAWWSRRAGLFDYGGAKGLRGLFAMPEGDAYRLYLQSEIPPQGFEPAPQAEAALAAVRADLRDPAGLFDLALPWPQLQEAIAAVGEPPLLVLPSAGRMLCRTSRAIAEGMAGRAGPPASARYEGVRLAVPEDSLARDWRARIEAVYDPDAILRGGERP